MSKSPELENAAKKFAEITGLQLKSAKNAPMHVSGAKDAYITHIQTGGITLNLVGEKGKPAKNISVHKDDLSIHEALDEKGDILKTKQKTKDNPAQAKLRMETKALIKAAVASGLTSGTFKPNAYPSVDGNKTGMAEYMLGQDGYIAARRDVNPNGKPSPWRKTKRHPTYIPAQ